MIRFFNHNREVSSDIKMSQIKKGDKFSDGFIVKKKYFFDNEKNYVIYLSTDNEVKYRLKESNNSIDKISNLGVIKSQLEIIIPFFRKDLNIQLANVYKLAILDEKDSAISLLENLNKQIVSRKQLVKKFIYLGTPLLTSFLFYVIMYFISLNYSYIFLFSGIGSFLSISRQLNKIEFNTSETTIFYFGFAIFKYLYSLFSSIILILLYKSNILNIEFKSNNENFFLIILVLLGSFCESLIPNIFEKLGEKIEK